MAEEEIQPWQGEVTPDHYHHHRHHDDSHFFYRAALALNNMAVTMLERHCYKQAFLTLKDAVFCMMVATKQQPSTQHKIPRPEQGEQLQEILHKASQRAARPESSSSSLSALSVWLSIQAIWDTDPTTTCLLSLYHSDPEDSSKIVIVRPIRMDDLGMDHLDERYPSQPEDAYAIGQYRDSDLYTSIILYNFGLAHYCRSRQTILTLHHHHHSHHHNASNYQKNHQKLLEHAIQILGLSRQMILAAGSDNSNDDPDRTQSTGDGLTEDPDWLVSSRRLLLSTLVLHVRARIYTDLQQQQQQLSSRLRLSEHSPVAPAQEIHWQQRAQQCRQQVRDILTLLWTEQRRILQQENHNLAMPSSLTTIVPSLIHSLELPVAAERWNDDRSSHLLSSATSSQNIATIVLAAAA